MSRWTSGGRTKRVLARRTISRSVGPNEAHGLWHQKTSAQNPPGYSGRSAPPGVWGPRLSCRAVIHAGCKSTSKKYRHRSNPVPIIILDKAGWHTTGKLDISDNITLLPLPPRSPELNPVENVWQYLRQNRLSNRVFQDQIVSLCCDAWNNLTERPWKIMSIGHRSWAYRF